jgi:hypothetical protein
MATEPTINKINYTPISEAELKKQVETQLKPQYQSSVKQLEQQQKESARSINSDALARGLARSSYVGRMLNYNDKTTNQSKLDLKNTYDANYNSALAQLRSAQQDREFNYLQYNNSLDQWLAEYKANQEAQKWTQQFQQDQFNWQKQQSAQSASRSSSGSGSSGGGSASSLINNLRSGGQQTYTYDPKTYTISSDGRLINKSNGYSLAVYVDKNGVLRETYGKIPDDAQYQVRPTTK